MKILFLTEGGKDIGFGHISRCSALADGFIQLGHTVKMHIRGDFHNKNKLTNYNCYKTEWFEEKTLNKIIENYEIIVIDSYLANQKILALIADLAPMPVFLIDSKLNFYPKGIILFPSIYAEDYANNFTKETHLLLGQEFLLFGKIMWNLPLYEVRKDIKKVAVSLGGYLDDNTAKQICDAIHKIYNHAEINIFGEIKQNFKSWQKIIIHGFLSKEKYIKKLFENDILIVNGGQTLNEALLIGIPSISVSVAENQIKNAKAWEKRKLSTNIDPRKEVIKTQLVEKLVQYQSLEHRKKLNQNASQTLSPNGAVNAATNIVEIAKHVKKK